MKYRILEALKSNKDGFLSGEALSRQLEVSRTAVWKYINELRLEGYDIASVSRRGYRLAAEPDIINSYVLSAELGTGIVGKYVKYFDRVDSTNLRAKELAADCEDGTVIVAGEQTAGNGRYGRKWESKEGAGIYMSVILKPEIPPEEVQLITLAASVAVATALKETTGIAAGIKWPNDVVLDGRKVCGILTVMSSEMERVNYIVLGIGINFSQKNEDFPEELQDKAISVLEYLRKYKPAATEIKRSDLARAVFVKLDELYGMLLDGRKREITELWRKNSATLGKEIWVTGKDADYTGKAVDITDDGRLVVICEDGSRKELLSGEVSVRGLLGYI